MAKTHLAKTERTKNTQLTNAQIDALISQNHGQQKHPEPILKHARTKNGIYTNRQLFENAFEIAAKDKFQQYCRRSR